MDTVRRGLIIAVVVLVGCSPAEDTRSVRTIEGSGIMQSSPVNLSGDYTVRWTASEVDDDTPDVGCYHSATLRPVSGRGSERLGSADVSGTASGTTAIYGLDAGSYYVDAASGCDWRIVLTPA